MLVLIRCALDEQSDKLYLSPTARPTQRSALENVVPRTHAYAPIAFTSRDSTIRVEVRMLAETSHAA